MIDQFTESLSKLTDKFANWIDQLVLMLPNLAVAILIVIAFVLIAKFVRRFTVKGLRRFSDNQAITTLLSNIVYMAVVVVGIFVALGVLQLDKTVTSLLAGVGVVGLALGFAFQTTAANFISGVFMAARHPIHVGDIVDTTDYFGVVDTIDMRFTKILTPDGQMVIIPNKTILENPLVNYSLTGRRRVNLKCGISYGENLPKVKEVAMQAIEKNVEYNQEKDLEFMFTGFGDSSINFVVRFWIDKVGQKDYLVAAGEAVMALKKAFDENDIVIPFPIRTLDFGIKGGQKLSEVWKNQNN